MIIGNPNSFAIQIDAVPDWNTDDCTWTNGLLSVYLDGKRLFDAIEAVELKTTLASAELAVSIMTRALSDREVLSLGTQFICGETGRIDAAIGAFLPECMVDAGILLFYSRYEDRDRLTWVTEDGGEVQGFDVGHGVVTDVLSQGLNLLRSWDTSVSS